MDEQLEQWVAAARPLIADLVDRLGTQAIATAPPDPAALDYVQVLWRRDMIGMIESEFHTALYVMHTDEDEPEEE